MEQEPRGPRRRRGRRGGRGRPQTDNTTPSEDSTPDRPPSEARAPRRDSRRSSRGGDVPPGPPPGPPGTSSGGIRRAPMPGEDRGRRQRSGSDRSTRGRSDDRSSRSRDDRGRSERDRDRGPRVFEAPVPQDEHSVELGAAFKEAQAALRDARKLLDKRKTEFGDEPEWMLEQYNSAEQRFTVAADEWAAHLETTGRKVVRR